MSLTCVQAPQTGFKTINLQALPEGMDWRITYIDDHSSGYPAWELGIYTFSGARISGDEILSRKKKKKEVTLQDFETLAVWLIQMLPSAIEKHMYEITMTGSIKLKDIK